MFISETISLRILSACRVSPSTYTLSKLCTTPPMALLYLLAKLLNQFSPCMYFCRYSSLSRRSSSSLHGRARTCIGKGKPAGRFILLRWSSPRSEGKDRLGDHPLLPLLVCLVEPLQVLLIPLLYTFPLLVELLQLSIQTP